MQKCLTLTDAVWPIALPASSPTYRFARNIALMIGFSAMIGLCAHVQFHLAFTPVPITGQTFGVLLTGALLGSRLGAATVVLYVLEGLSGLPVFSSAGTAASFGYLIGFPLAAYAVGLLAERGWDRRPWTTAAMMVPGSVIIYAAGALWLQHFVGGLRNAFLLGVVPFLIGDGVKALAVCALLPAGWKLVGKRA